MEIFESPCFNTWRFKNLHVLKHGGFVSKTAHIFESPCFIQYMEIQKPPCIKHINFLIFMFQYMQIQKYPRIETWRFKNFRVLYTKIFLKANYSVKSQQMMKIFQGVNQGTGY